MRRESASIFRNRVRLTPSGSGIRLAESVLPSREERRVVIKAEIRQQRTLSGADRICDE